MREQLPSPGPSSFLSESQTLLAASERSRKRSLRLALGLAAAIFLFYVGSSAGAVYLADTGRVALLREIATGVGIATIMLFIGALFYALTQPPFTPSR